MPAVTRVGLDSHVGHASPTPNPFHQTAYATGSSNVFTNGAKTVRIGDTTSCGDPAAAGSPNVFVNKINNSLSLSLYIYIYICVYLNVLFSNTYIGEIT